ncbi:MAG: hypothetical protein WKF33_07695 [Thermoleophilaceae bacterium]
MTDDDNKSDNPLVEELADARERIAKLEAEKPEEEVSPAERMSRGYAESRAEGHAARKRGEAA